MTWMSWQIDYLLLLQNIREVAGERLDEFFLFISNLGIAPFVIMLMCILYWGINKRAGIYMIYCLCFSNAINILVKQTACIPRPWIIDNRVTPPDIAYATAGSYSFPSGHTAGATAIWGSIAVSWWKNKIIRFLCFALILLIMFSRNYLGVHTPQDVIVSLILGIGILIGINKLFKWSEGKKGRDYILIGFVTLFCLFFLLYIANKAYPFDCEEERIQSLIRITIIYPMMLGCFLEQKFIKFDSSKGGIVRKILRIVIGLVLLKLLMTFGHDYIFNIINNEFHGAEITYNIIFALFITILYPSFIKITDIIINLKANRG